ncbi:MAG: ATP-binding response regulator [Gaiellaceae bacterium]
MSKQTESAFRGFVAHELRSPITVIIGLAATLSARRQGLTEAQVDQSLEQIRLQGERLAGLVDDLLDLAQVDAGRFRVALGPVDLSAAGERALRDAPAPPGRSVELALPDDLLVVADGKRLDQVLVNLLTNAYRHGGPKVRLEARPTPEGMLVVVSDNGAGVSAELVPNLFEAFTRGPAGADGGTGLGLAIVRALVEAFGGRVWYEPGETQGARFAMLLDESDPVVDNRRDASEQPRIRDMAKVLIVDDESNMRFLLRMLLESDGYDVVEAKHGAEALTVVTEAEPDIVVTDLMMPIMNGRQLIANLRSTAETAEIPILVVSSRPNANVPGADAILRKPFDIEELLATARSLAAGERERERERESRRA